MNAHSLFFQVAGELGLGVLVAVGYFLPFWYFSGGLLAASWQLAVTAVKYQTTAANLERKCNQSGADEFKLAVAGPFEEGSGRRATCRGEVAPSRPRISSCPDLSREGSDPFRRTRNRRMKLTEH